VLLEPPRADLPARSGLTAPAALRLGAAVAALVLAALSRGDAVVLAAGLAIATWRPLPVLSLAGAAAASSWRWGSSSLEAWAGAQAVLGPAGWVGPSTAAAASWAAGVAVLLAASRPLPGVGGMGARVTGAGAPNRPGVGSRRWVGGMGAHVAAAGAPNVIASIAVPLAAGAAAAAIVAGPAPGGAVVVRLLATVVAFGIALGISAARRQGARSGLVLDIAAVVAAAAAVALAAVDAGAWSGTISDGAMREGVVVALAAGSLAAAAAAVAAMGGRRS